MNQEIKTKWLTALRSGEYKQTTGALRKDDCFCALGVLCDIYSKENNIPWMPAPPNLACTHEIQSCTGLPHQVILEWAEITALTPIININDTEKASFSEVADFIEANL